MRWRKLSDLIGIAFMMVMLLCIAIMMMFSVEAAATDAGTMTRHTTTEHDAALVDALIWMYSVYNSDLGAAGQTESYLISTPATNKYHFEWEIHATSGVYMYIYENPTIADTSTAATVYVKNRTYDTASPISVYVEGQFTLSDAGSTIIRKAAVAGGNKAGGFGDSETGWILAQSEEYLVILTAIGANPAYSLTFQFHKIY